MSENYYGVYYAIEWSIKGENDWGNLRGTSDNLHEANVQLRRLIDGNPGCDFRIVRKKLTAAPLDD